MRGARLTGVLLVAGLFAACCYVSVGLARRAVEGVIRVPGNDSRRISFGLGRGRPVSVSARARDVITLTVYHPTNEPVGPSKTDYSVTVSWTTRHAGTHYAIIQNDGKAAVDVTVNLP